MLIAVLRGWIKALTSPQLQVGNQLRHTFILFCVALLVESIGLQIATQLSTTPTTFQAGASGNIALSSGSVATATLTPTPSPTPTDKPGILSNLIQPVQAATTSVPQTPVLIFHFPLRSYTITQYFNAYHLAIDLAAPTGTPIFSTTIGTVTGTGYLIQGGGLMVKVDHPDGYVSYYAHMSAITSSVGQQVDNQTQIGKVGATGWATGPHVHFMILHNGTYINPMTVLK